MTTYICRFIYYQYNTGNANNGYYPFEREFKTLEEALKFKDDGLQQTGVSSWLWDNHHIDGFLERFDGIYRKEITKLV